MAEEKKPPPSAPKEPPENAIIDRRRRHYTILPNYIIDDYARWIGPTGVLVYLTLCRFAGSENACWPAAKTLANRIGMSEGTIWRQMGALVHYGLVVVENRAIGGRKTSNRYILVDPADAPETKPPYDTSGHKRRAGAPTDSAQARPTDSAQARPTDSAQARPTDSAQARDKESQEEVNTKEGGGVPPTPIVDETGLQDDKRFLVALWMTQLVGNSEGFRASHKAEIRREIEELLRRGLTLELLEAAINDPDRDRSEWPRLFRARMLDRKPQKQCAKERAAKVLQFRANEAAEAAEAASASRAARALVEQLRNQFRAPSECSLYVPDSTENNAQR